MALGRPRRSSRQNAGHLPVVRGFHAPDGLTHLPIDQRGGTRTTLCEGVVFFADIWLAEELIPCDDAPTCVFCATAVPL